MSLEATVDVIGAGPSGLATALGLLEQGHKVKVYDRLGEPVDPADPKIWSAEAGGVEKFYLIGLGGRGQKALKDLGVWDKVSEYCSEVVGRKDWSPGSEEGVERIFTDRPYTTMVLPRDKLVGALYQEVLKKGDGDVEFFFGKDVEVIDFGEAEGNSVQLTVNDCVPAASGPNEGECDVTTVNTVKRSSDFVVAADGAGRSIAEKVATIEKYVDDNVRIYKTIPLKLPADDKDWNWKLNFSARTGDGRFNLDALPASKNGDYCAVMLLKEDDPLAKEGADPDVMREDFDRILPQFSQLISDDVMKRVAAKPVSRLPSFRYIYPRLHRGKVVVLGDAAHSVKPYFGLGANSALEDVIALTDCVKERGLSCGAAEEFSKKRAGEAKALVKLSRGFDRPGKLGFATFILPLILDGIFHGMLPKLFSPNTIAMLQASRTDSSGEAISYTFQEVVSIKRFDRVKQAALVSGVLYAMGKTASLCLGGLATLLRRSKLSVGIASSLVLFFGLAARRFYSSFSDNSAGEVLAKTETDINGKKISKKKKFEDNESFMMSARQKQRERDGG
ncbi:hypothetical protein TrVE_jg6856 [Triparma verrucosa]|uniref:FAD-binding domain-containing protein n=1 Tax=Triparma verrucosa TaxID=1606542 RepID=A0A9W7BJR3_9STRA|nr:hypothetical protein TrVE_jg6856 [Triparma verrucosa]